MTINSKSQKTTINTINNQKNNIGVKKISQKTLEEKFSKNKMLVALRARPLLTRELEDSNYNTISVINNETVSVSIPTEYITSEKGKYYFHGEKNIKVTKVKEASFKFDFAFDSSVNQSDIYQITTSNLVKQVVNGFNATVFAYGATGTGKTYTMVGEGENSGIMIRSVSDLFKIIKQDNEKEKKFGIKISYIEIYNEIIKDLLSDKSTQLEIRTDAQKGVVLVTLNYRLGMCGFLAHPFLNAENEGKGSGNYGIFDQLAALKWVKQNIEAFGGNPDNVTVFGQSAGAGSVQALISSPLAKGYIQRAIIQSGGGLGGIISTKSLQDAEEAGKAMWEASGYTTLEQMRACPTDKFQEVMMTYMKTLKTFNGLPYSPCVDGQLLEASVHDVALQNNELDIPYMIGYTSEDIAPPVMKKAAVDWSLLLEKQGRQPAYVYCFSRDLPGEDMPAAQGGFGDMKGAFHSSELWYMFGTLDKCWRPMEKVDYELSERMVSYWTNFAKTGSPNGEGLPVWKPCTKADNHIQDLNVK